jgi:hypothetical protein
VGRRADAARHARKSRGQPGAAALAQQGGGGAELLAALQDEEADDDERGHEGDDGEEAEGDAAETAASKQHFVSTVANLLVEGSEGASTRPAALYYLLHSPRGAALVRRLHHQKKLNKKICMSSSPVESSRPRCLDA